MDSSVRAPIMYRKSSIPFYMENKSKNLYMTSYNLIAFYLFNYSSMKQIITSEKCSTFSFVALIEYINSAVVRG